MKCLSVCKEGLICLFLNFASQTFISVYFFIWPRNDNFQSRFKSVFYRSNSMNGAHPAVDCVKTLLNNLNGLHSTGRLFDLLSATQAAFRLPFACLSPAFRTSRYQSQVIEYTRLHNGPIHYLVLCTLPLFLKIRFLLGSRKLAFFSHKFAISSKFSFF